MLFEINFNTESDDKVLEELGAKLVPTGSTEYPPFEIYKIELNTFEELENLLAKVDKLKSGTAELYSAILGFNPATIYLDTDV
jgi:hypothetical protein